MQVYEWKYLTTRSLRSLEPQRAHSYFLICHRPTQTRTDKTAFLGGLNQRKIILAQSW